MNIKLDIIERIEFLRNNKKNYNNIEEYNYKINRLYNELSTCIKKNEEINNEKINNEEINNEEINNEEINNESLFNTINLKCNNIMDILALKNIKKLSCIFPLFDLYLIENNVIEYTNKNYYVQTIPILDNYNKNEIIKNIKLLLHLSEISTGYKNKVILFIIIYDELFKNFKFVLDDEKFHHAAKNKLNDLQNDIDKINEIIKKYDLNKNLFDNFKKEFGLK